MAGYHPLINLPENQTSILGDQSYVEWIFPPETFYGGFIDSFLTLGDDTPRRPLFLGRTGEAKFRGNAKHAKHALRMSVLHGPKHHTWDLGVEHPNASPSRSLALGFCPVSLDGMMKPHKMVGPENVPES